MKSSCLLLSFVLLFVSTTSSGQIADHSKSDYRPLVNKGYYSIGDNYKKPKVRPQVGVDSLVVPTTTKGYNSISPPKKSAWFFKQAPRPKINKGYYSIDSQMQKTDRSQ